MKKTLLILLCLTISVTSYAQENGREHKGFYLSMGLGPVFGNINMDSNVEGTYAWGGTGAVFDLKIGGAIKENLILHATMIGNSLAGPSIRSNGVEIAKMSNNYTINESTFGAGLTYYIMPANAFLSGSAGIGQFNSQDTESNYNVSTKSGFSMQLKIGKEWWVSRRWGLGAALTYGMTNVNNNVGNGLVEKLNSNRFGIMFNATLD